MVLVQKWSFFHLFLFKQFGPGKCLLRYSRKKKRLSRLWKQEVEKVKKLTFFPRGYPVVLVQKRPFFQFFFSQFRPGKCLLRYSRTKKPLSRLSEKHVQKVEKLTFVPTFFFRQFRPGKFLLRYSRTNKRLSTL